MTSDGRLAIRMDENHAEGRTDPGIIEGNLVTSVVWHDPETQTGDTIEVGRTVGRTAVIPRLAGFPVPLMPETLVAIDPAGSVWTAHSDRYEVIRLTSGGDTSLVVRVDAERNGNGDSLRDDAIDEIRDWFEERGVMSIDWDAAVPEPPPILANLFVDGDGRVWVQRAGKGLPVFDVFTTDGELAGRYRLDARLVDWISPVAQGGWLVAVTEDEYGASGVVIVPLEH